VWQRKQREWAAEREDLTVEVNKHQQAAAKNFDELLRFRRQADADLEELQVRR
jgi:hypothetical protein